MNIVITNERYLSMSVIIWTPTGVYPAKKPNATGNTKKYANDIPSAKNRQLDTSTGTTSRFSPWQSPGATNSHACQSTNGSAIRNADISVTLSGTRNVPVTSVAIIVEPAGSTRNS